MRKNEQNQSKILYSLSENLPLLKRTLEKHLTSFKEFYWCALRYKINACQDNEFVCESQLQGDGVPVVLLADYQLYYSYSSKAE